MVINLPSTLTTCKSIQDDVATLGAWTTTLLESSDDLEAKILKNIKGHGPALASDVNKARRHWNLGEFFLFGEELGVMLVIATS